jgi:sugar phosphate isomerase/epimerase
LISATAPAISEPFVMKNMEIIRRSVQVNIPFTMLWDKYADTFFSHGLNPEIGIDAAALDRFTKADFKLMADRIRDRRLRVTLHGPFSDLSPGSIDPMIRSVTRNRFDQLLEVVFIFKPISVVCHAGYEWKRYGYLYDEWFQQSIEMWSWLAKEVNNLGSRLMLENVYEAGPQDMDPLFRQLEKYNVGFCLDTGHQAAFSRSSLKTWLSGLGQHLAQLHLHDNGGKVDEHLALGSGRIDFSSLFRYLAEHFSKSPPLITLEPHTEDALEPSLVHLSTIWPW